MAKKRRGKPLDIEFTDEKAIYHNTTGPGGNKKKIRRLLPVKSDENFNTSIANILSNILQKLVFKIIAKNNR